MRVAHSTDVAHPRSVQRELSTLRLAGGVRQSPACSGRPGEGSAAGSSQSPSLQHGSRTIFKAQSVAAVSITDEIIYQRTADGIPIGFYENGPRSGIGARLRF